MRGRSILGEEAFEGLADEVGVDGRSVGFGEDVAAFVATAGGHAVFELAPPVQPQMVAGVGVEVDGAAAGGGGVREVGDVPHHGALALGVRERALDGDADGVGRQAASGAVALAFGERLGIEHFEIGVGPR